MNIDERLRKLITFVGDEAARYEQRDLLKLEEVLAGALATAERPTVEAIQAFVVAVIASVPNKQHIYAVLTGLLAVRQQQLGQQLIDKACTQLQKSLNACELYACKNVLIYLAELMNLGLLNSFVFYGLLEDIAGQLEQCAAEFKLFYLRLMGSVLPSCWSSLSAKLSVQFKKLMERLRKATDGLQVGTKLAKLWSVLLELYSDGRIQDFSKASALRGELLPNVPQFNPQLKLSFKERVTVLSMPFNETFLELEDEDDQYREFDASLQAFVFADNISAMVHSFWKSKKLLSDKLVLYVTSHQSPHLPKFLVECLFKEALCRPQNEQLVVYSSLLVQLSHELDEKLKGDFRHATEETALAIFRQLERHALDFVDRLADVMSFYLSNLMVTWEWQKWLLDEENFAKRAMLLRLTFEKVILLSENGLNKESMKELSQYIPKSKTCVPVREIKDEISYMARTVERLTEKADSDTMQQYINNFNEFEMFLECLLTRMSNSITHLNVLSERYRKLFKQLGRPYEKLILVGINSFWANSQYHKLQYITLFLEKQIVSLETFIQWTSVEAKVADTVDKILLERLFRRVFARCGRGFDNKEMLEEVQQSLEN